MEREREISLAEPPAPTLFENKHTYKAEQINFRESLNYQATDPQQTVPAAYKADNYQARVDAYQSQAELYSAQTAHAASIKEDENEPHLLPNAGDIFVSGEPENTSAPDRFELPADWKIIGYLRNTYIMIETSEGLEIVEQHIAHERTLYERLLAAQKVAGRITEHSQKLIVSAPLALKAEQLDILKMSQTALEKLGFKFEFSDNSAAVRELPLELARINYVPVIQKLIADLSDVDAANLELEATKSIACQSAIKNGMPLSQRDILKLLHDWLKTERHDTCPHGRPVRLKFSMDKLFQMFHPA